MDIEQVRETRDDRRGTRDEVRKTRDESRFKPLVNSSIRYTLCAIRYVKGFSLVEILIVVAILGILAAVVVPTFKGHAQLARESAAKENLQILRNAIERYAVQHNGVPPGYINGDTLMPEGFFAINQLTYCSNLNGRIENTPNDEYRYGPYLNVSGSKIINPFNQKYTCIFVSDFPETPDGTNGWLYNPATKDIRIDWPGTDSKGVRYLDY